MGSVYLRLLVAFFLTVSALGGDPTNSKKIKYEKSKDDISSSDFSSGFSSDVSSYVSPDISSDSSHDDKNDLDYGSKKKPTPVSEDALHYINHGGEHNANVETKKGVAPKGLESDHLIPAGIFEKAGIYLDPNCATVTLKIRKETHGATIILAEDHAKLALTNVGTHNPESRNPFVQFRQNLIDLANKQDTLGLLAGSLAQYQFAPADAPYNNLLEKYAAGLIQAVDQDVKIHLISKEDADVAKAFFRLEDYEGQSFGKENTKMYQKIDETVKQNSKSKKYPDYSANLINGDKTRPDKLPEFMKNVFLPQFENMKNFGTDTKPISTDFMDKAMTQNSEGYWQLEKVRENVVCEDA